MKRYDPHENELAYLQELAGSYWTSEVLFSALDAELFEHLQEAKTLEEICHIARGEEFTMKSFLRALVEMGFLCEYEGHYCNTLLSNRYLVKKAPLYQGDFILWLKDCGAKWQNLGNILKGVSNTEEKPTEKERVQYIKAMNALTKGKSHEILAFFDNVKGINHILAVGPGAQGLIHEINKQFPQAQVQIEDEFYQSKTSDDQYTTPRFSPQEKVELIILCHLGAWSSQEDIVDTLTRASECTTPNGYIAIYDLFHEHNSLISNMANINRSINPLSGKILSAEWLSSQLKDLGLKASKIVPLESGESLLFSSKSQESILSLPVDKRTYLLQELKDIGFKSAKIIDPKHDVYLSRVSLLKCRHGCDFYHKETCYTNCRLEETEKLLNEYRSSILIEGEPPTKDFQILMLQAERQAFKLGFYKAFSLWAGPCSICDDCIHDKAHCSKTRPSMENYGIDVYKTVHHQGDALKPLAQKGEFVKYYGLLLLE